MRIVLADRGCILLCSMDVNFSGSKKRTICANWKPLTEVCIRECSPYTHEGYFENRKYVKNLNTADVYFCDMTMWAILRTSFQIFN